MKKTRIFIADHDRSFVSLMQYLLREEGYTVIALDPSEDAFTQVTQARPDLLILDTILDRPDAGWALLDKLAQNPETTHLPVIICSSEVHSIRIRPEYLATVNCPTLEKPFDIDVFLSTVKEALIAGARKHGEMAAGLN